MSVAFFAEAGQDRGAIEVSGVLEEKRIAVNIPPELALLGVDSGNALKQSTGKARSIKPVGTIGTIDAERGDFVKRGDTLLTVSEDLARDNLKKAQAKYDLILTTIETLEGQRDDLGDKKKELDSAEAELTAKRLKTEREFNVRYAEGRSEISGMKQKLASTKAGLEQAQAGLSSILQAEVDAQRMLEDAQALPDSDPTKTQRVEQATAALSNLLQQKATLDMTVRQLTGVKSKLESGIPVAEAGLTKGKQRFNEGVKKMDQGAAALSEGREKIKDGTSKLSRKLAVLKKRRDQAEVGLAIARSIMGATKIKANSSGIIRDSKVTEGSVVYPGQRVLSISRLDKLTLNAYIPLEEAGRIAKDDAVEVMVDAAPGHSFKGTVIGVGGKAVFAPANLASGELELIRVIRIKVEVVNEDGILKAGMPADIRIEYHT